MTAPLRLTSAAEGIHLGQCLDPGYCGYWTAECAEITGPVDVALLCEAIAATVRDAEALHARFPDGATQTILLDPAWRPEVVRLAGAKPRDVGLTTRGQAGAAPQAVRLAETDAAPDDWPQVRRLIDDRLSRAADLGVDPLFQSTVFIGSDRVFWYIQAHHIVLDGFGYAMLYRQVSQRYRGQTPQPFGRLADLVADDITYRDGDKARQDRDYWTTRLAGQSATSFAGETALPDRRTIRMSLPGDLLTGIGAAWPHRLLALVAAALHRRTGTGTPVLGLPVSGRLGTVAARVPGMVMNIAPLPVPIALDHTVDDVTATVAATLKESRRHQRYRYEWLRGDLDLSAGRGRVFGPVVNVIPFAEPPEFGGCGVHMHHVSAGPVDDLAVTARGPQSLALEANPQLYSAEALESIRDELVALAAGDGRVSPWRVIDGPPRPEIRPLPELIARHAAEAPAIVDGQTTLTYGQLRTSAHALATDLTARGVRPGDLVAVQLPRGAEAITAMLGVLYCGAGYLPLDPDGAADRNAAILTEASPAFTIDADTTLPDRNSNSPFASRLAATGQVAGRAQPDRDPAGRSPASEGQTRPQAITRDVDSALPRSGGVWRADDPAYVIYTSGSTGRPKGVAVPRSALDFFVASAVQRYGFTATDRVLQFAPLHFDAHVEEIFVSLAVGATLVVRDDSATQSLSRFADFLDTTGVTMLDLPTAYWHELVQAMHAGLVALPDSVSTVIIGGEAASPHRLAQWHAAVGDRIRLVNSYGPTEATVVCLAADLNAGTGSVLHADGHRAPNLGDGPHRNAAAPDRAPRPSTPLPTATDAGHRAAVGQAACQASPSGAGGDTAPELAVSLGAPLPGVRVAVGPADELYLAGPGLASGYLDRPAASATSASATNGPPSHAASTPDGAQHHPATSAPLGPATQPRAVSTTRPSSVRVDGESDPFIRVDGERWYRTGDIVAVDADGQLFFRGRADSELKISGHRIHPGEVEVALTRHPAVAEAVVIVEHTPRPRLVAYVATDTDVEALREHARRNLPTAAVPASIHVRDRLPRTSTGKIDRLALAEPVAAATAEPATEAERVVLAVFAEVLGSCPAADADFFASGGTSLPAIAAATRLSAEFGREVTAADLFAQPTAAALAAVLSGQAAAVDGTKLMRDDQVWHSISLPCLPNGDDAITLTGATGFVGSHILAAMLATTDRPIRCLVRGDADRLREAAARFGLPEPELKRVTVIDCDLSRPVLGLDIRAMSLVSDSQAIVNCAASVNFTSGYAGMRTVNVEAVRTLLELACVGGSDFHQVSTVAVCAGCDLPEEFITERSSLADGYQRTKWVAERLVEQVGAQGLPVSCHRLGRVVPTAGAATHNPEDFVAHLIRASLLLGCVPRLPVTEPWVAADVAADCIVDAVVSRSTGVWNLGGEDVNLTAVWDRLCREHPRLERGSLARWRELLETRDDTAVLKSFFDIHGDELLRVPDIDNGRFRQWLADNDTADVAGNLDWCSRVAEVVEPGI